jgi:curved DNA-binding protein CbpA
MVEDYFEILGVHRDASQAEVQKAFRDLAWKFHPDVHPEDKTATQKFQQIENAFEVLNDPERRKTYVARLRSERFLTAVEETYLVPDNVLQKLRRRVARSKKPLRAAAVAEHLIKKGHLTRELAQRLLAASSQEVAAPAQPPAKNRGDEPAPAARAEADEDLQLAPLDDDRWSRYRPYTPEVPSGSLLDDELPGLQADAGAGGPWVVAPRRTGGRRLFSLRRRPRRKANVWDSPLLLIGVGILLALVLMLIALLYA